MVDTEELANAESEFRTATANIMKCLPMIKGGAKHEDRYGTAYQRLVRLGVKPQLRGKYRA